MDCFAYCKINKCVITIFDSFAYYKLRQRVITIYDSAVITILDNCYYNLQQVLQFTTLLQFTRENMMIAALPIACVQTAPLSSVEIGEGPLLRFLLRGGGSVHRLPSPSIYVFSYFRSITSNSRHLELFPWKVRLTGSRPYFFTF